MKEKKKMKKQRRATTGRERKLKRFVMKEKQGRFAKTNVFYGNRIREAKIRRKSK